MAVNAASHNAGGIPTGPSTEPPPPVPTSTKSAILSAAGAGGEAGVGEPTGQSVPGKDQIGNEPSIISHAASESIRAKTDGIGKEEKDLHVKFKGEIECGPMNKVNE